MLNIIQCNSVSNFIPEIQCYGLIVVKHKIQLQMSQNSSLLYSSVLVLRTHLFSGNNGSKKNWNKVKKLVKHYTVKLYIQLYSNYSVLLVKTSHMVVKYKIQLQRWQNSRVLYSSVLLRSIVPRTHF